MSADEKLASLRADVDDALPKANRGVEPVTNIFLLPTPGAPVITVTRDERVAPCVIPVHFVAGPSDEALLEYMRGLREGTRGLAPLAHGVLGARCGRFLLVPAMYHMFPLDSFIEAVQAYVRSPPFGEFVSFWDRCFVGIVHEGTVFDPAVTEDGSLRIDSKPLSSVEEVP